MGNSRLFGIACITAGASLVATLLYEPSDIVAALGLKYLLSEASVVVLSLTIAVVCGIVGCAALGSRRRPESAYPHST